MFRRLIAPSDAPFTLDLTERDLLADLDPGWLAWHVVRPTELATTA